MGAMSFEPPILFGALCDGPPMLPRHLSRRLATPEHRGILLPFSVERRFLKNVVACMRLMDIMGLVVLGAHRTAIARHLSAVDPLAADAKSVDVIARRKVAFKGYNAQALACLRWLREHALPKHPNAIALIVGEDDLFPPLFAALRAAGMRIVRAHRSREPLPELIVLGQRRNARADAARRETILRTPAVRATIDLGTTGKSRRAVRRSPCLTRRELEQRTSDMCVELLTSAASSNQLF
jgi:shikimate 5-dehydrogenase